MPTFVIDVQNYIKAFAPARPIHVSKGAYKFESLSELTTLTAGWPGTRLVEIWNKLPNLNTVRRFTDRKTAIRRIWGAIQKLDASSIEQSHPIVPDRGRDPAKTNRATGRDDTKTERIIALLKRPSGATLNDIMAETGWQPHSVRGFISGQVSKHLGFRVKSFKRAGARVYRIH